MHALAKASSALALGTLLFRGVAADNGVYIQNEVGSTIYATFFPNGSGTPGNTYTFTDNTSGGVANTTGTGSVRVSNRLVDNVAATPAIYLSWDNGVTNQLEYGLSSPDGTSQPFLNTLRLVTPANNCTQITYEGGMQIPPSSGSNPAPHYSCAEGSYLYLIIESS